MLAFTVVPAMRKETSTKIMVDRNLYFFRVRADGAIWFVSDCPFQDAQFTQPKQLELLLKRQCLPVVKTSSSSVSPMYVKCPPLEEGGVALNMTKSTASKPKKKSKKNMSALA
ncbi:MAG: hypothetical protein SGARI_002295 [Bacillariaceae sp.]